MTACDVLKGEGFEVWWETEGRHQISGYQTNAKQVARTTWNAAKAEKVSA